MFLSTLESDLVSTHRSLVTTITTNLQLNTEAKMKVKELRSWLQSFEEKNKEHYRRSHDAMKVSKSKSTAGLQEVMGITANDIPGRYYGQELPADKDEDDIKMKPSAASTSPSSSFEDDYKDVREMGRLEFQEPLTSFEGMGNMSTNHVNLLRSHATPVLTVDETEDPGHYTQSNLKTKPSSVASGSTSLHSTNLLGGRILTKANLDFICQDEGLEGCANKIKSTERDVDSLTYSHDGDVESLISSASISVDSETPSIAAGALVGRMADMFLKDESRDDKDGGYKDEGQMDKGSSSKASLGVVTRKIIRPEDLPFLKPSSLPEKKPVVVERPLRNTVVGRGIRKFGNRKSIVERRKEQLNQKFLEQKEPAVYERKVKRDIHQHGGGYKKKVVVEKQYN